MHAIVLAIVALLMGSPVTGIVDRVEENAAGIPIAVIECFDGDITFFYVEDPDGVYREGASVVCPSEVAL